MTMMYSRFHQMILGAVSFAAAFVSDVPFGAEDGPPVDRDGRPLIRKLGTIGLALYADNTLVTFQGRFYSLRWFRDSEGDYSQFVDYETGEKTPPFARGYGFAQALADDGTMYVTVTGGLNESGVSQKEQDKPLSEIAQRPQKAAVIQEDRMDKVHLFSSKDLIHWESRVILDLPGWMVFTSPMCKADGRYVMMLDVCSGPADEIGAGFTCRFAESENMLDWKMTPKECVYAKDRYTAGHFMQYLDGYFYNFYLEAHKGWEMRVVRSKDLIHWETSPLNPVLRASEEDRKPANPDFTEAELKRVATAVNINNSDMCFAEYKGQTIIHYFWGDQQTPPCGFARAIYDGTQEQFLRGWFPDAEKPTTE